MKTSIFIKSIIAFASASFILHGCSMTNVEGTSSYPLSFSIGIESALETKVDNRKTSSSELDEFYVAGFNNDVQAPWFPETKVHINNMRFPDYAWKSDNVKTFYAYANIDPTLATAELSSDGISLNYSSLPTTQSAQRDFLLGGYQGSGEKGKANLTFYHPLASVAFKLGTFITDGATVIKGINLSDVYISGECSFTFEDNIPKCAWTSSDKGMVSSSGLDVTPTEGATIGDPFILIPQNLSSLVPIEIVAEVDGNPTSYYGSLPRTQAFEAGKTITFTVSRDGTDAQGLCIEASVADWGDGGTLPTEPVAKEKCGYIKFSAPTEHTIFLGYKGLSMDFGDNPAIFAWSYDGANWHSFTVPKSPYKQVALAFGGEKGDIYYKGLNNNPYLSISNGICLYFYIGGAPDVSVEGDVFCIQSENYREFSSAVVGPLFFNCTALKDASGLLIPDPLIDPNGYGCYNHLFEGCTNLTAAPDLPATTLAGSCYYRMFAGCTSLTKAPDLPATTLADYCYSDMFNGCTSLVKAPELPAATLTDGCYSSMFYGCTSLVKAPELPAATLTNKCYERMFYGCTSLSYIKMLAISAPYDNCFSSWLYNVSSTGEFVKAKGFSLPEGASGIPAGWTVIEE